MILRTVLIACLAAGAWAAQPSRKTCSLLTKAEIKQIVGVAPGDGIPNAAIDSCRFPVTGRAGGMVVVTASRDASADSAKKLAVLKKMMTGSKITDLAKLGDRAVRIDTPMVGTQVSIFRGPDNLLVSVMGLGDTPKISSAAEALARKAFSRF